MQILALALAALALALALLARARCGQLARRLADLEAEAGRRSAHLGQRLEGSLETTRQMLAALAGGARLSPEQVLEGRLWRDIDGAEGQRLVAEEGARLIDVRSPQETRGGFVPGALLVPVDELERRLAELPRDGRATIVYCAMGARSAFACELLTREGFSNLHNLEGGIGAWRGPLERPAAG